MHNIMYYSHAASDFSANAIECGSGDMDVEMMHRLQPGRETNGRRYWGVLRYQRISLRVKVKVHLRRLFDQQ